MNINTRHTIAAALAAAAFAVVPATSAASDGGAKPMSSAETYALTCGHLGVPCDPPHARHHARSRHAHGARHHRRRH